LKTALLVFLSGQAATRVKHGGVAADKLFDSRPFLDYPSLQGM
jgi:hypothetical protein